MADISKIKPNGAEGTEYNVKDAAARSQLGQLKTAAYKDITNSYDATSEDAISGKGVADAVEVESLSDTTPYVYRQSPAIGSRVMENALVGGSVAWNQLVQNGDFSDGTNNWSTQTGTITVNNGICTFTGNQYRSNLYNMLNIINGHKYLLSAKIKLATPTNLVRVGMLINNGNNWGGYAFTQNTTNWQTICIITNSISLSSGSNFMMIRDERESGWDAIQITDCMVIDLTQLFGTTIADYAYTLEQSTAGSGIAWLRENGFDFSKYIAYNTGTLESVNPSGKKVVGFNLFNKDATWTSAGNYILNDNGQQVSDSTSSYYLEPISVFPNTAYFVKGVVETNGVQRIYFFDKSGNFISRTNVIASVSDETFTTPNNCSYIRIQYKKGLLNIDDWCINISKPTGSPKNGDYLPYETKTYPLGSDTLRGIPKLVNNAIAYDGDVKESSGKVTRKYGIVDLGSLTWSYNSTYDWFASNDILSNVKVPPSSRTKANAICSQYQVVSQNENDSVVGVSIWTSGVMSFYNNGIYTDVATFKTAMSGVYLIYELATPTTETSTPFDNPQLSYVGGTEEWITENDVPVGHISEYKALPEWTEDDYVEYLQEQAENVGKIKSVSKLGTYSTSSHTFANLVLASDSINNVFTYISELVTKVYTAVNDLASALANKANNTDVKGTYDKYTYSTSTHKFDEIAVAEPNKTAIYMAGDINDKLVAAINDHGTVLANVPSKTVVVNQRAIDVGDEFSVTIPTNNFLLFELTILGTEFAFGSTIITGFSSGSIATIVANYHGNSYWCDLSLSGNTITVDGNFTQQHGELTITAF